MRVLILTHGTRGDCQPFIDLANGFHGTGHEIILGAPRNSTRLVTNPETKIVEFDNLVEELLQDEPISDGMAANFRGITGIKGNIRFIRKLRSIRQRMVDDMFSAAELDADVVVYHAGLPGHYIAEWLGVAAVPTCLAPFAVPNKSIPHPNTQVNLPSILNRASYLPGKFVGLLQPKVKHHRAHTKRDSAKGIQRAGAPRRNKADNILIHAFSEKILPPDAYYPTWVHTTGFWFPKDQPAWQPTDELISFLSGGESPVYIGFGSMVGDPHRTHEIIMSAIRKADVRAILSTGWGGITHGENSEQVFYLREASFKWLFPRVSAIVHHGGCGTVSMAFNAGKPQVICPFIHDQHFFARQMHSLRVAPEPLPQRKLDASTLARRIRQVLDDERFASRAEEASQQIRAEDGIGNTISLLEQLAAR